MRVVADTNTILSGLLWSGAPRRVLDAARADKIDLYTTAALLAELEDVLNRDKLARRLASLDLAPRDLVAGYAALARLVEPAAIAPAIAADPDDDAVLACALSARAECVVSGDHHLLDLARYRDIPILTAGQLLAQIPE
jgi:uncharacterized protein